MDFSSYQQNSERRCSTVSQEVKALEVLASTTESILRTYFHNSASVGISFYNFLANGAPSVSYIFLQTFISLCLNHVTEEDMLEYGEISNIEFDSTK